MSSSYPSETIPLSLLILFTFAKISCFHRKDTISFIGNIHVMRYNEHTVFSAMSKLLQDMKYISSVGFIKVPGWLICSNNFRS